MGMQGGESVTYDSEPSRVHGEGKTVSASSRQSL
jgi:hypothetical protein